MAARWPLLMTPCVGRPEIDNLPSIFPYFFNETWQCACQRALTGAGVQAANRAGRATNGWAKFGGVKTWRLVTCRCFAVLRTGCYALFHPLFVPFSSFSFSTFFSVLQLDLLLPEMRRNGKNVENNYGCDFFSSKTSRFLIGRTTVQHLQWRSLKNMPLCFVCFRSQPHFSCLILVDGLRTCWFERFVFKSP